MGGKIMPIINRSGMVQMSGSSVNWKEKNHRLPEMAFIITPENRMLPNNDTTAAANA